MRGLAWQLSGTVFGCVGLGFALLSGAGLGCTVLQDEASDARETRAVCTSDSECSTGHCQLAFGVCSQPQGQLTRLLFEITPPASDPVYGGARFLTIQDVATANLDGVPERGIEPGWMEINVRPRVPVTGSVSAESVQAACPSRARSTLPMHLTFTPRESLFGLSASPYEVSTRFNEATDEFEFRGLLPPGHYDVYMRPDSKELGEDCTAVPQIFRNRVVGDGLFELPQPPPSPLRLTIPWKEGLEGWTVDVVHPVTGEIISNRVRLRASALDPKDPSKLEAQLIYSNTLSDFVIIEGEAPGDGGAELIRFAPPDDSTAGTVLLQRTGVGLATPGEGQIGDVLNLGTPVDYQAWVWKRDEYDTPVPGTVRFAARDLDDAADGVPTAFDTSVNVDALGRIQARLLPGRYRVRVTPPGIEVPNLGLLSSYEKTITVWPNESGDVVVQGGHVIEVPSAVTLTGRIQTESGAPIDGVEVQASASNASQDPCPSTTNDDEAVFCDRARAVLRRALAQDPFVPRTRNGLSRAPDGEFSLTGLDCGQCEPGAGARFDLSVRPPVETGLPWLILRGYPLDSNQRMRVPLRVPRPVAHAIRLTYGDPTQAGMGDPSAPSPVPGSVPGLAGALVRVYALIDAKSQVVTSADAVVPCVAVAQSEPCTQSAVQVAELRSGPDGKLLLLLPPSL
ncbi:MAG: hypothetical protein RL033_3803 [Pseudomonadota bacterium]|jgi:hypothetical protein